MSLPGSGQSQAISGLQRPGPLSSPASWPLAPALLSGSLEYGGLGALQLATEVTKEARLRQFQSMINRQLGGG